MARKPLNMSDFSKIQDPELAEMAVRGHRKIMADQGSEPARWILVDVSGQRLALLLGNRLDLVPQAARSMAMSYRHAWELIESMNRLAPAPLVETSTGGKGGGGTKLTPEGEKTIKLFRKMHRELLDFFRKKEKLMRKLE